MAIRFVSDCTRHFMSGVGSDWIAVGGVRLRHICAVQGLRSGGLDA